MQQCQLEEAPLPFAETTWRSNSAFAGTVYWKRMFKP